MSILLQNLDVLASSARRIPEQKEPFMAHTKTAFAKALGVSKSTISRYCAQGMAGHLSGGTIDEEAAREWVRTNIRPHVTDAGAGGAIGAGAAVDDIDDDTDAVDDIAHERARLTRFKADMAQIELDRLRGDTEEEQKLKLIETAIFHLWWAFQRQSPHALTGVFLGNGWLNIKDGPSCARRIESHLGARLRNHAPNGDSC
jgi:phage terminase Nu1 subunit (DNA packaging protein)